MSATLPEIRFNLPVITLCGSAFQRGYQHGTGSSQQIARAIYRMKQSHSLASYEQARGLATASWRKLQKASPKMVEEIRGIAAGSNSDLIDLYCHIGFEFFETEAPTGCSGIAVAADDGAVIGQNWDCPPDMIEDLALFLHFGEAGFELAVVATVGTLGWVGQNSFGLAVLSTDIMLDKASGGLPSQVIRRLMLSETSVTTALAHLDTLPVLAGRTYLLGDRLGTIAAVEVSPSTGVCRLPETRRHFHTNHALAPETIAVEDETRLRAVYPSSRMRLSTLQRVGVDANGVADIKLVLANHEDAPNAISKTISSCEPTMTAFSIIFDCSKRDIYLCSGPPSRADYLRFRWNDAVSADVHGIPVSSASNAYGAEV